MRIDDIDVKRKLAACDSAIGIKHDKAHKIQKRLRSRYWNIAKLYSTKLSGMHPEPNEDIW